LTVSAGGTTRVGDSTGADVAVSRVGVEVGVSEPIVGCAEGDGVGLGNGTVVGVGVSKLSVGCAEGDGVGLGSGTAVGAGVSVSLQPLDASATNRTKASKERFLIMPFRLLSMGEGLRPSPVEMISVT